MPTLKNLIKTQEVTLPVSGAHVTCAIGLTFAETLNVTEAGSDMDRALRALSSIVKDWDFVDEAGIKVPVTLETIGQIPTEDAQVLMEYVGKIMTPTKEKVSQPVQDESQVENS